MWRWWWWWWLTPPAYKTLVNPRTTALFQNFLGNLTLLERQKWTSNISTHSHHWPRRAHLENNNFLPPIIISSHAVVVVAKSGCRIPMLMVSARPIGWRTVKIKFARLFGRMGTRCIITVRSGDLNSSVKRVWWGSPIIIWFEFTAVVVSGIFFCYPTTSVSCFCSWSKFVIVRFLLPCLAKIMRSGPHFPVIPILLGGLLLGRWWFSISFTSLVKE